MLNLFSLLLLSCQDRFPRDLAWSEPNGCQHHHLYTQENISSYCYKLQGILCLFACILGVWSVGKLTLISKLVICLNNRPKINSVSYISSQASFPFKKQTTLHEPTMDCEKKKKIFRFSGLSCKIYVNIFKCSWPLTWLSAIEGQLSKYGLAQGCFRNIYINITS